MEASKITISDKTYDLSLLNRTKRTNLRRKAIIEYIQSKPAGEIINMGELQRVAQIKSYATAWSFVKIMIRDGIISQYKGDKPKSYYYSIIGATRLRTPKTAEGGGTTIRGHHLTRHQRFYPRHESVRREVYHNHRGEIRCRSSDL